MDDILRTITESRERFVAAVVHLNDTYLIDERPDQGLPGFPRVIATVNRIRDHVRSLMGENRTLVLHSGDFLGPSRVGKNTQGQAMIELMNRMGVDYCTLGNHEFDYREPTLSQRLAEANFPVLLANLQNPKPFVRPMVVWPSESTRLVALTGVVSESVSKSFYHGWECSSPLRALEDFVHATPGVVFRLILTHASRIEDRELRNGLPQRTYILGGHDHDIHWSEEDGVFGGVPLMKNLSNLQTVRVCILLAAGASSWVRLLGKHSEIEKARCAKGAVLEAIPRYPDDIPQLLEGFHPLDRSIFHRELTEAAPNIVQNNINIPTSTPAFIEENLYLADLNKPLQYPLEQAIYQVANKPDEYQFVLLRDDHEGPEAEALKFVDDLVTSDPSEDTIIREFERNLEARDAVLRRTLTDFGVFVAECVRCKAHASIGIINAGAFRCDALLPSQLRLRNLRDTFLFDNERAIMVLDLSRDLVEKFLDHGRSMPGEGAFPQVSPMPIPNGDTLRVAIASYLLINPSAGFSWGVP